MAQITLQLVRYAHGGGLSNLISYIQKVSDTYTDCEESIIDAISKASITADKWGR